MLVPFDRWDAPSSERWFALLTRRLEELLGPMGTRALMVRAINDAGRRCPLLLPDLLDDAGLHVTPLFRDYPSAGGAGCSAEVAASLQALVDSVEILLTSLLGKELTDTLLPDPSQPDALVDSQEED